MLITGMSGTGKSSVVEELRRRGWGAVDADDDGFTEPAADGVWRWRVDAVSALLGQAGDELLFFAGCSEEQALFAWDLTILLTAPEEVLRERLRTRTTNDYGRSDAEWERVRTDLREVEPVLRRVADVVIDTRQPLDEVLAAITGRVERRP